MLPALLQSGGAGSKPSFALGFADLGAGAVDTSTQSSPGTPTFTRATTAWTKLSTGLWASVATGVARSNYSGATTATGSYRGYLSEAISINLCLQARDMTQADWVKVNTTALKNATGIDGVANSASTVTCTSNGGSILQTVVAAASSRTYSAFIRRKTGTGTITIQQLTTTLDVTASLNSSTYTRVELNASELNSAFGIVFGTSGDEIEVDMNQLEAGTIATSPVPTTTATVTRNGDLLTYTLGGWFNQAAGTFFMTFVSSTDAATTDAVEYVFQIDDGTADERMLVRRDTSGTEDYIVVDGAVTQCNLSSAVVAASTSCKMAVAYEVNNFALCLNAGTVGTDSSGTIPTVTTLRVCNHEANTVQLRSTISNLTYFAARLPNQQLIALTA